MTSLARLQAKNPGAIQGRKVSALISRRCQRTFDAGRDLHGPAAAGFERRSDIPKNQSNSGSGSITALDEATAKQSRT
ncbi:hypothetical protein QZM81_18030 [Burkholderia cepacia]|uniref:hypothetical protein n=1 Tax=Burkholderia cepacia TaxID=292 RepID=UPI002652C1EB|nr:hypothetical protein [Burkholderia cepacia]MDN7857703.1 hypothetical protein [Burkholderia cepacia]